ncbi:anti-repressor SinI family protein [Priestia megaterium]|uniref:anti-repressor SinI family protein n=1 Tax=Priestia megaterium TaxID=1404 RepID=UPI001155F147|nr:anti-repressor SinI family protein [Priestia megaterium]
MTNYIVTKGNVDPKFEEWMELMRVAMKMGLTVEEVGKFIREAKENGHDIIPKA